MVEDKIILGIDPGTSMLGYGLINIKKGKLHLIHYGVIKLKKITSHPEKLKKIHDRLTEIIKEYKPDEMAIEAPFFGKNVQSMLKLGKAQGICIAVSLGRNIPFEEYTPRRIKQSITGKGSSSKEQVAEMIKRLLNLKELPDSLDASDALGVAICHHYSKGKGEHNKSKSNNWASYIKNNPDKKR